MGWSGYIPMHVLYTHIPEILFYFRTCIIDSHSLNCLFLRSYRCIGSRVCACTPRGLCLHSSWFVLMPGLFECFCGRRGGGVGGGWEVEMQSCCTIPSKDTLGLGWELKLRAKRRAGGPLQVVSVIIIIMIIIIRYYIKLNKIFYYIPTSICILQHWH